MTEFEMMRDMLFRIGYDITITEWESFNDKLIEDETNGIDYWFKDDKLDCIQISHLN